MEERPDRTDRDSVPFEDFSGGSVEDSRVRMTFPSDSMGVSNG